MKKVIVLVLASSLCFTAAACNAVKGLGRDIESVGDAGDRAI
jgi:predicted small secreted protein